MEAVKEGASDIINTFANLFTGGDDSSKTGKYIAIGIVAFVVLLIIILIVYLIINNSQKKSMTSNRIKAGCGACCRDNQLWRLAEIEPRFSSFDQYTDGIDRGPGPEIGPRYSADAYEWPKNYPYSYGTGYDNVQGFASSEPDGDPYQANAVSYRHDNEALVKQKVPVHQYVSPFVDENLFINYAGQA